MANDHLGGTVGMLDSAGAIVSSQRYWPYGAARSGGVTQTDELFTGQKREDQDTVLGLYNYKARFYSTTVGRFMAADSSVADGLNRFTYVRNNPLTYNDPTGHRVIQTDDDGRDVACPSTRPDCLNDGGPRPRPDPCDANCRMLRGIYDYCHSAAGASNPSCGGPAPAPDAVGTPTPENSRTVDASPLPESCGGPCPRVRAPLTPPPPCDFMCHFDREATDKASTLADHVNNVLTDDCVQGATKVTAVVVGSAVVVSVVGPEAAGAASLFISSATVDVTAAYAVGGNAVVVYGIAKYGSPAAQPGASIAFGGFKQLWNCVR